LRWREGEGAVSELKTMGVLFGHLFENVFKYSILRGLSGVLIQPLFKYNPFGTSDQINE